MVIRSKRKQSKNNTSSNLSAADLKFLQSMRKKSVTGQLPMLTEQVMILSNRKKETGTRADRRNKYTGIIAITALIATLIQVCLNATSTFQPPILGFFIGLIIFIVLLVILDKSFDYIDKQKK